MGRAGRIALVTLTAVALILACGGLLAGCRAKLPADFSRMREPIVEGPGGSNQQDPAGMMPPAGHNEDINFYQRDETKPPKQEFEITASYDRPRKLLSIAVQSNYENDSLITIGDVPAWIELPVKHEFTMAAGEHATALELVLLAGDENTCSLQVSARDKVTGAADVSYVTIHRPLYFTQSLYDFTLGTLDAELEASSVQSGFISIMLPRGVSTADPTQQPFAGSGGFNISVQVDRHKFKGEDAYVSASDQFGNFAVATSNIGMLPDEYAADTLYAYPHRGHCASTEFAEVVVATGATANPFAYLNGVRVTFTGLEPSYVPKSLNVGAIGGSQIEPDGIWAHIAPHFFLLPLDFMMETIRIDEETWAIDFNVTPIDGRQIENAEGELFNFQVAFSGPGTAALGFSEFADVMRTYYSDGNSLNYCWGDISNDHPGVANAILVTE